MLSLTGLRIPKETDCLTFPFNSFPFLPHFPLPLPLLLRSSYKELTKTVPQCKTPFLFPFRFRITSNVIGPLPSRYFPPPLRFGCAFLVNTDLKSERFPVREFRSFSPDSLPPSLFSSFLRDKDGRTSQKIQLTPKSLFPLPEPVPFFPIPVPLWLYHSPPHLTLLPPQSIFCRWCELEVVPLSFWTSFLFFWFFPPTGTPHTPANHRTHGVPVSVLLTLPKVLQERRFSNIFPSRMKVNAPGASLLDVPPIFFCCLWSPRNRNVPYVCRGFAMLSYRVPFPVIPLKIELVPFFRITAPRGNPNFLKI